MSGEIASRSRLLRLPSSRERDWACLELGYVALLRQPMEVLSVCTSVSQGSISFVRREVDGGGRVR